MAILSFNIFLIRALSLIPHSGFLIRNSLSSPQRSTLVENIRQINPFLRKRTHFEKHQNEPKLLSNKELREFTTFEMQKNEPNLPKSKNGHKLLSNKELREFTTFEMQKNEPNLPPRVPMSRFSYKSMGMFRFIYESMGEQTQFSKRTKSSWHKAGLTL